MTGGLRIGASLRGGHGVTDVRAGARWMVERARAARQAGLDSLFLGDHHVTGFPYYQNVPMLGRLLGEWGDAPAGALFLLPLWHPVLLAEQFGGMGGTLRGRAAAFETNLAIVRRLLAGEEVTVDRPAPIRAARIGPLPPEPVQVWIAAAAPAAIDRAARLGEGWIAGPALTVAEARAQLDTYRERCAAHGRPVRATVIRRDVHVGADQADADRVADPVLAAGYRGFPPDAAVVGGPEHVGQAFAELAEMGYTEVLVRHLAEDQAEVLASYERLADVRAALVAR